MLCMVEDCIFNLCPPVRIIIMLIIIMTIYQFSLVVQWLGIHLPMQGTWVQSLSKVWEDST